VPILEGGYKSLHSRPCSLLAIKPQRSGGIVDSEAILRDRCVVGRNRQEAGIDARVRGSQPSAWIGEGGLGDGLATDVNKASGGAVEWAETNMVAGHATRATRLTAV
jgi:hypothetical protein